jgi:hypothetical protein
MQECRITITLFEAESDALYRLARLERRDTRGQAAFLLRQELTRRGLLRAESPAIVAQPAQNVQPQGVTHDSR